MTRSQLRPASFFAWLTLFAGCSDEVRTAHDTIGDVAPPDVEPDSQAFEAADATDRQDGEADGAAGDSGPSVDGDGPSPEEALALTIDALCPDYARAWCGAANGACGCSAAPGFPAESACRTSFEARCARELGGYLEAARSGQAVYQPDAAPACLAALQPLIDACLPMASDLYFVACPILSPPGGLGELPGAGAPCEGTCALGLRCGSDGLCHAPGGVAAGCADLRDCAPTLVCLGASEDAPGRCVPPDFGDRGKACASSGDCGGDTTCAASARKSCVAPVPGQVCRYDEDCVAGEYCVTVDGLDAGVCTAVPGVGAPCGNGTMCADGLGCDMPTGLCASLPLAGQPCALGVFGPLLCAADLGCLDGICGALPALGEACAIGTPSCADGLGCAFEPDGSFCREPAGAGAPCQNDATCDRGHYCDYGVSECTADLPFGAPCRDGNECGAGACLPDASFAFRCAPEPGVGEACFLDECAEGLVCRTPYASGACVPEHFCRLLAF